MKMNKIVLLLSMIILSLYMLPVLALADVQVDLSWHEEPASSYYIVEIATDESFNNVIIREIIEPVNFSFSVYQNGYYYARVSGVNSSGQQGIYSDIKIIVVRNDRVFMLDSGLAVINNRYYANPLLSLPFINSMPTNAIAMISLDNDRHHEYIGYLYVPEHGYHTINYFFQDRFGHRSVDRNFEFFVDRIKPTTHFIFDDTAIYRNNSTYVPVNSQVEITALDNDSGVKEIWLSMNGENYVYYQSSIQFGVEGEYFLTAYSFDNVGNFSNSISTNIIVDDTPPELSVSYLYPPMVGYYAAEEGQEEQSMLILNSDNSLQIHAEDAILEIEQIEIQIDEEAVSLYHDQHIFFDETGIHRVRIRACDELFNWSHWYTYYYQTFYVEPNSGIILETDDTDEEEGE